MASGNDDDAGEVAWFLMMVIGLLFVGYVVLVSWSLVRTVWALMAWNQPSTIWGHTLEPWEARPFVARGLVGAVALPLGVLLGSLLFGNHVDPNLWVWIALGGYGVASLGLEMLESEVRAKAPPPLALREPLPAAPSAPPAMLPAKRGDKPNAEAERPFVFASWDDEEEHRK